MHLNHLSLLAHLLFAREGDKSLSSKAMSKPVFFLERDTISIFQNYLLHKQP